VFLTVARARSFSAAARELGVSRAAVSQAVRQLEDQLKVVLLTRTTRSVSLTDTGRRLVDAAGPAMAQAAAALSDVSAKPGEVVGRLRLSIPRLAVTTLTERVLPPFRARHPRIDVEVFVDDHLIDIVAAGFDAGVRQGEIIDRDMVRVRLTPPFRFVVVGTPEYLARRGTPEQPEDLVSHECITFRSPTNGALYAWELERGRRTWKLPAREGLTSNDGLTCVAFARRGLGLAYAPEVAVAEDIRRGKLRVVLESYAPTVPGFFLYYPSRTQRSGPLALFIATTREVMSTRQSKE
jgi:DNA-binding transcriptional LysR family regulator